MSQSRQLAAIMFTDIVGFTTLMGNDEAKAIELLKKNRELQKPIIEQYTGRWIKELGDGVMASFNTVSDAVNAAIKIQEACSVSNDFLLRIGIHLGEVVFENDDVFGDGVNVASRIVSLAEPGGIYVSGKIYAEIKNHKNIESVFLGMYDLKNVASSVEIFAISNPGIIIPEKERLKLNKKAVPLKKISSKKTVFTISAIVLVLVLAGVTYFKFFSKTGTPVIGKSIAVLPFINLSSDKDDEYFADGMCDEILTNLAKIGDLKVISHTSVLQYKNTKKNLKEIANELGVNTILEGSVQKSKDRVRINVQLINAENDEHLWAEKYDRKLEDVFGIQSEVAEKIANQLEAKLSDKEKNSIEKIPTKNIEAYNIYLQAKSLYENYNLVYDTNILFPPIHLMEKVVSLDPDFTLAWCSLVGMHTDMFFQCIDLSNRRMKLAKEAFDNTVRLEPNLPEVHFAKGVYYYHMELNYDKAIEEFETAKKDIPNNSELLTYLARVHRRQGKWKEAIDESEKACLLSPKNNSISWDRADFNVSIMNFKVYADQIENLKKLGEFASNEAEYFRYKSALALLNSNMNDAEKFIDLSMSQPNPGPSIWNCVHIKSMVGKYKEVIDLLMPHKDSVYQSSNSALISYAYLIGLQYHYMHNETQAKIYFEKARNDIESLREKITWDKWRIPAAISLIYAGLGMKEKAIAEGKKIGELMPMEKDQLDGLLSHYMLARIYAWFTMKDEAINEIKFLQKYPGNYQLGDPFPIYKIDPVWNSLKGDPLFEDLWDGNILKMKFSI